MKKLLFMPVLSALIFASACGGKEESITYEVIMDNVQLVEGNVTNTQVAEFELSNAAKSDLVLSYEIIGGDATAGEDYNAFDGSLTVSSGEARFSITVEILGDIVAERNEEIIISLMSENTDFVASDVSIVISNDDENNFNLGELVVPDGGYDTPTSYEGYALVWSDEFEGDALNTEDWGYQNGNGCPNLCGWGNQELQFYMNENVTVADGHLIIEAKREEVSGSNYTSGRITTKGKRAFQYGRIDIRANMPYGQGMWPALWMLGENQDEVGWPACGEIDIMEMVGGENGEDATTFATLHWDNAGNYAKYGSTYTLEEGRLNDNWHVYSIVWDEELITFFIDDIQYHAIDITPEDLSEFKQPYFFIFNIAVGGTLPGNPSILTVLPQYMLVDYVRVFQPE